MAPWRSSTTVILQPTLNGLFFLYIRMYKCKTISELHLPKTSCAAASQSRLSERNTQGVYFIQSFFNIGSLKVISIFLMRRCTKQRTGMFIRLIKHLVCLHCISALLLLCRQTRKPIKMFNKESGQWQTDFNSLVLSVRLSKNYIFKKLKGFKPD